MHINCFCLLLTASFHLFLRMKGGYNALNMGFPHEAMVDMTGGITEVFMLASLPQALGSFLRSLLQKGALINCANSQVYTLHVLFKEIFHKNRIYLV